MITGKWNLKIKTPMNTQTPSIDVTVEGDVLTGTLTDGNGTVELTDGRMADKAYFKAPLKTPFGVMVFDFALEVDGDTLSGKAKMKMGSMTVTGVRA